MGGYCAERRNGGLIRRVAIAVLGIGALSQVGRALAGPLVHTSAFKWATMSQIQVFLAKDNGTVANTTITYSGPVARVVVVVPQPEFPFPKFQIDQVENPTLVLPAGATVKFTFVNEIKGFSHSFQVTRVAPPFAMFPKIQPVLAGTELSPSPRGRKFPYANFIWHPTAGHYYYVCAIPGHAEMGMYGAIIVK